jgi:hypothetical protein
MTTDKEEQDERRQTVLNDARVRAQQGGTTFATFAEAFADEERGGRFRGQTPQTIVGAEPVTQYPAAASWTHDPCGPEPSLGIDINEMAPTGEAHEVEASIAAQNVPSLEPSALPGGQGNSGDPADALSNSSSPLTSQRTGSPPFLKNKR